MKYKLVIASVLIYISLAGCATQEMKQKEPTETLDIALHEALVETEQDFVNDTVYGVECRYVKSDDVYVGLKCEKHIVQEDWITPADGWNVQEYDDLTYINQVYDENDVLLLPIDYGSNTYRIIGIDAKDPKCEKCGEESSVYEED